MSLVPLLGPDDGTGSLGSMLRIMGPYFPASLGDLMRVPVWEFLMVTIWSHGRTCCWWWLGSFSCEVVVTTTSSLPSRGRARFKVGSVAACRPCERKPFRSLAEDPEAVEMIKKNTTTAAVISWCC
ncbi:Uncharacterized protein TCM_045546 [Theobroma cacao]|uniref:Uncharacterized protein n=1 Tax=Theobroma cacao TaxID=3641 RepID=A0A061FSW4_THECC|nr:Uncharacterized protein TCM_045546 [Theobroma cacao]